MNIAIADKDLKRIFSLFPTVIEEFRDHLRVFSDDIYHTPDNERESQVFLAKQKYITNMESVINIGAELLDCAENYNEEINDNFVLLDLIRGVFIYGVNRQREVDRAIKTEKGESFIISENHTVNIYGSSIFEQTAGGEAKGAEDLTYIFNETIGLKEARAQFHSSIAQGDKVLKWLVEDGEKIDRMKVVSPELNAATKDIRAIASIYYNTREWVWTFSKRHFETHDDYEIYQYFLLFYASFARKFHASYWQYRVENGEALNIHDKLVACLK